MPIKPPTRSPRQRGQSLLETAMMIVVIFTIVFWVFELGWLMYTYTVMEDAANEGVRYAIVHSSDSAGWSQTKQQVRKFAQTSLHDVSLIQIDVSPDGATVPNSVQVKVTYTYVPWLSHFISTPTMTAYAKGNLIQ